MEVLSSSTRETKDLAGRIAKNLNPSDVLALYGELGSGKTTFVRYLVEALGLTARVQSPTFVLVREYRGGVGKIRQIYHVDLYRLQEFDSISDLGIEEMMETNDSITIVEWPEKIEKLLPDNTKKIYFEYAGSGERKIKYEI